MFVLRNKFIEISRELKVKGVKNMKYAGHGLKKRNGTSNHFEVIVIIILASALIIGTLLSKVINKYMINYFNDAWNATASNSVQPINDADYVLLQCGIFSKKENAAELSEKLNKIGRAVEVQDGNRIRVIFGIYNNKDNVKAAIKLLGDNKFEESQIKFNLKISNSCDVQIIDIINADIKVFDKLQDNNVKAIGTKDFKTWVNNLKKSDKNYKNSAVLTEFKEYVNKLPDQVTKDNLSNNSTFLYNEIKKYSNEQ